MSGDIMNELIEKLAANRSLTEEEYAGLIEGRTPEDAEVLAGLAREIRENVYGRDVYIRGLMEISNYCRNDCLYCGIRRSNRKCIRYRLDPETILACAVRGYELGFRTFVMQGGEDGYYTDELLEILIKNIKAACPGSAVTLSLGERGYKSFKRLYDAGADRYLLRHETADPEHYAELHPPEMSYKHRMKCLEELHEIGYQTGCGFMVGTPGQTAAHIAKDLKFIETFRPEMCGVGPFIPHHDTPFKHAAAGSADLTVFLLSVIRIIHPSVLLPATTALGTVRSDGRERGILAGANVIMPNLSPREFRKQYELYDNKLSDGAEAAEGLEELKKRMESIGYRISMSRGDYR